MKKVLIALDYDPSAQLVAETGYAVAKALQAEITIVHVITEAAWYALEYSPIMGYQGGYTAGTNELVADIQKDAENYLAATVKHLGDSTINIVTLNGDTTEAILSYSIEWNADLIVLGSHSRHGLERLFSTDTVAHILKHARVPVLAIPTTAARVD